MFLNKISQRAFFVLLNQKTYFKKQEASRTWAASLAPCPHMALETRQSLSPVPAGSTCRMDGGLSQSYSSLSAPHSEREREKWREKTDVEGEKHSSSKLHAQCVLAFTSLLGPNALQCHILLMDVLPSAPYSYPLHTPLLLPTSSPRFHMPPFLPHSQLPFPPSSLHRPFSPSLSCKTLCLHQLPILTLILYPQTPFSSSQTQFCLWFHSAGLPSCSPPRCKLFRSTRVPCPSSALIFILLDLISCLSFPSKLLTLPSNLLFLISKVSPILSSLSAPHLLCSAPALPRKLGLPQGTISA